MIKHKKLLLINFLTFLLVFATGLFFTAGPIRAALLKFSPEGGTMSESMQIELIIDTEGVAVDSSTAVVSYDPTVLSIASVSEGAFFDSVAVDISQSGEAVFVGTFGMDQPGGKTGSGNFVTLFVEPLITSGNAVLYFRCNSQDIDDTNIMDINGVNLLATDEQCERNVEGLYTVSVITHHEDDSDDVVDEDDAYSEEAEAIADTSQPALPDELPESGPRNWLRWIVSGLAFIGIGLLLF